MATQSGISVMQSNGVKIYDLSLGKSLPQFLEEAKKERVKLKKLKEYRNRIELIQDFEFKTVCNTIRVCPDGKYIIATGIYPPSIKIFDTSELSLKCERGVDSEVVKMEVLAEDYSKLAFLCDDRNIEVHAQYGKHFKLRIPRFGRDLLYCPYSADLLAASTSNQIFRLNLELGQFLAPFESDAEAVNVLHYSSHLNLLAAGTELGTVEFHDYKSKKKVMQIPSPNHPSMFTEMAPIGEITALQFSPDGMRMTLGSQNGKVLEYDLRYPLPLHSLQFQYRKPITRISYDEALGKVYIADKKILKIYNSKNFDLHCFVEPKSDINDFALYPNSGLIFMALENSKIGTYFVPSLGLAPKWCSFLENMTEELEETVSEVVYENYKFLSKTDLEQLNASHLIGTNMLNPVMHGYLMEYKHYEALRSVQEPEEIDLKKKKVEAEFKKLSENRIILQKVAPKVNRIYAKELMNRGEGDQKRKGLTNILSDTRFGKMFTEKDYTINVNSEEYLRAHPHKKGEAEEEPEIEEAQASEVILPAPESTEGISTKSKMIKKIKSPSGANPRKRVIIPTNKLS